MNTCLDVIIIDVEVSRLDGNINDAKILFRYVDLAFSVRGLTP
jgi:hypothetical protein